MASDGNLKTWVSDKLMSLLGYSQSRLVQYVIGLSKQATSPADVVSKLVEFGLSSSSETRAFAEEIFGRVPHKASGLNSYQKQERGAVMIARKTYALLDADDEDEDDNRGSGSGIVSVDSTAENKRGASRSKRFRKKDETQDEDDGDDDEEIAQGKDERRVKQRTYSEDDDGSESDEEMLRDQRERVQLEKNLRERDAAATRKLTEPKLSKKEEEEAIRRSKAMDQDDINALRKVSRQEYLKKREQKKLEEIRDDIEDEQYLFDGVKLSEKEECEMRYKKQIFELVKKRTEETDDTTEYQMPDTYDQEGGVNQEKRFSVVTQRYRDTTAVQKMNPFAEQEAWEDHQIEAALSAMTVTLPSFGEMRKKTLANKASKKKRDEAGESSTPKETTLPVRQPELPRPPPFDIQPPPSKKRKKPEPPVSTKDAQWSASEKTLDVPDDVSILQEREVATRAAVNFYFKKDEEVFGGKPLTWLYNESAAALGQALMFHNLFVNKAIYKLKQEMTRIKELGEELKEAKSQRDSKQRELNDAADALNMANGRVLNLSRKVRLLEEENEGLKGNISAKDKDIEEIKEQLLEVHGTSSLKARLETLMEFKSGKLNVDAIDEEIKELQELLSTDD